MSWLAIAACLVLTAAPPMPTPPCDRLLVEKNERLRAENERLYQENLKLALGTSVLETERDSGINEVAKYRAVILIAVAMTVAFVGIQLAALLLRGIIRAVRWLWSLRGRHRKR